MVLHQHLHGIFQRVMENVLQGLPHTVVYIDDILVTGRNEEEHISNLNQVLKRLQEAGLYDCVKISVCS